MFLSIDRMLRCSGKFGYYDVTLWSGDIKNRGKILKEFRIHDDAIGLSINAGNYVNINRLECDEEVLYGAGKM